MSGDVIQFMVFGVPLVCFVVGWFVLFGKLNGTLRMSRGKWLAVELGILAVAAASVLLAVAMTQNA
ncbi:MAG TPA: hypothetical protein VM529_20875 [Gemmata sp.]|nr:hypothetical protein [Gemmata sp.]